MHPVPVKSTLNWFFNMHLFNGENTTFLFSLIVSTKTVWELIFSSLWNDRVSWTLQILSIVSKISIETNILSTNSNSWMNGWLFLWMFASIAFLKKKETIVQGSISFAGANDFSIFFWDSTFSWCYRRGWLYKIINCD